MVQSETAIDNSIMVFEDDAVFTDGFATKVQRFMDALPSDWKWIYLGGQHIEQEWGLPTRVNACVYLPYNVHRSHAYALRGRDTIQYVYNHLNTPTAWRWGGHIDHRMGELHKCFSVGGVYVPDRWLVGQGEGFSSIKHRQLPTNFFTDAVDLVNLTLSKPFLAVVGANDRDRSLVAAALHELGVSMGAATPVGEIAPIELAAAVSPGFDRICRSLYYERELVAKTSSR